MWRIILFSLFPSPISCSPARYKDNPFSLGDAFASQWEMDSSSWGIGKGEEEVDITISSIRPIGDRYDWDRILSSHIRRRAQHLVGGKGFQGMHCAAIDFSKKYHGVCS